MRRRDGHDATPDEEVPAARAATKVCIVGFANPDLGAIPWPAHVWEAAPSRILTDRAAALVRETRHASRALGSGWEVWGFNAIYRAYGAKSFHRLFELHDAKRGDGQKHWREPWRELRIISAAVPLYITAPDKRIPKAHVFPKAEIEGLAPHGRYHAGSVDWLVGFATLEGFKHIRIVGVDFLMGGEPISARPCLEYWLGVAEGRGITTEVIGGDMFRIFHLMRSDKQYGYDRQRLVEDR